MDTQPGTVTVWQSGRLAPRAAPHRFEVTRDQWIAAALLALAGAVLAMYVVVLQRDVDRNDMQHAMQRSRAVAEAQCEADQPADQRGRCIALFNGDEIAAQAQPAAVPGDADYEQEDAARATTVSLLSNAR